MVRRGEKAFCSRAHNLVADVFIVTGLDERNLFPFGERLVRSGHLHEISAVKLAIPLDCSFAGGKDLQAAVLIEYGGQAR